MAEVVGLCNILLDGIVQVDEKTLSDLQLKKSWIKFLDDVEYKQYLDHFSDQAQFELGGSALNAIKTLAQLGVSTNCFGSIGNDALAELVKSKLDDLNIASHLHISEKQTGFCFILVPPDGERSLNTYLGACLDSGYLKAPLPSDTQIFHLAGYQWFVPEQKHRALAYAREAKRLGAKISLDLGDPAIVEQFREEMGSFIKEYVDIVFANEQESDIFSGKKNIEDQLRAFTAPVVVLKKGSEGAYVWERETSNLTHVPAPKTQVLDTTGAGDMFAAGFLYGIIRKLSLEKSARLGTYLAVAVIQKLGASLSEEEIQSSLNKLGG